jgi:Helix-turn-helix domain of resolvase
MTGASAAGARRSEFRRIDWHRAAELLAAGQTIAATADQIGCSRSFPAGATTIPSSGTGSRMRAPPVTRI